MLGSERFGVLVFCEGFVDVAKHVPINVSLNIILTEFIPQNREPIMSTVAV